MHPVYYYEKLICGHENYGGDKFEIERRIDDKK